MKAIIQRVRILAYRYNGVVYDILFILYSWIYGLLFRRVIVDQSANRFFERGDAGVAMSVFILLTAAVAAEIVGGYFITRRIRHIRTYPQQYPEIMNSRTRYISGDAIMFFQLWLAGCRVALSAYIGYIAFNALGLGKLSALGCLAFIAKDVIMFLLFTKFMNRPTHKKPSGAARYAANLFLAFSGMVFAAAGFEAFMTRSYNVLCNFHHWTGFGNFILSLILYFLFFSILYIPTRAVYYAEELEFVDSMEDARSLRKSFLITAALSILPWLF